MSHALQIVKSIEWLREGHSQEGGKSIQQQLLQAILWKVSFNHLAFVDRFFLHETHLKHRWGIRFTNKHVAEQKLQTCLKLPLALSFRCVQTEEKWWYMVNTFTALDNDQTGESSTLINPFFSSKSHRSKTLHHKCTQISNLCFFVTQTRDTAHMWPKAIESSSAKVIQGLGKSGSDLISISRDSYNCCAGYTEAGVPVVQAAFGAI